MNRRDFLQLLLTGASVTAAGLYLPKVIYSFPSQLTALNVLALYGIAFEITHEMWADDKYQIFKHAAKEFRQVWTYERDQLTREALRSTRV